MNRLNNEDKPECNGGLCDKQDRENREDHSYNPNNTCYIHSCENQHVSCIEQRKLLSTMVSTMVAICYHHHQVLQHPIQKSNQKSIKTEHNTMYKKQKTLTLKTKKPLRI